MKALLLGGNGFIGSHLIDRLLDGGHSVRVLDRGPERYREPLANVEYRLGSMGETGLLNEAVSGVDTVVHLASTTLPQTSNEAPAFDVESNVVETIGVLERCVDHGVGKVVFVSSGGAIYGAPRSLPASESEPTEPLCSYGITKLAIEKYLSLFQRLHGLDYVILRPSNAFGPRQDPFGIQGAVSVFLGKVARGQEIEVWGTGDIVRDYLYVSDVVDGIVRAASKRTPSRIFNLGSGTGTSLNQLLEVVSRVTGATPRVRFRRARAFDVTSVFLRTDRAREELGWVPATALEDGIQATWDWVRGLVGQEQIALHKGGEAERHGTKVPARGGKELEASRGLPGCLGVGAVEGDD